MGLGPNIEEEMLGPSQGQDAFPQRHPANFGALEGKAKNDAGLMLCDVLWSAGASGPHAKGNI